MMEFTLKRVLFSDDGALGVFMCGKQFQVLSLEEDWRENKKGISCIPEGSYLCQRVDTPKHGDTFQVMNVPGRSAVLIHWGNSEADTEGCILLGMESDTIEAKDDQSGKNEKQLAILRSKEAFQKFMNFVGDRESCGLHIKNC